MALQTYIGKGTVLIGKLTNGVLGATMPFGNCPKLSFAISEETKTLLDYTTSGGGELDKVTRVKSVEASIDLTQISPENLEIALRGTSTAVTTGTVTDEQHTAYQGGAVIFAYHPDLTGTITIKSEDGNTNYVKDTDYVLTSNGIDIITGGSITNASTIKCTYTKLAGYIIQALVNSGDEYVLIFRGLNEAKADKPVTVKCHRVKFSPTASLDFIGDDFNKMTLKASLLADSLVVGTELSKFFTVSIVS